MKISIREALSDLWADMSAAQKFVGIALALLVAAVIVGSWWNTFQAWSEIRVYERQAAKANQEKAAALELAAKVANTIRIREEELKKIEVKRNEKLGEVKDLADDAARDRAEYERAVRERLREVPSTDELCRQLAALGYGCYR